jgi:hypothetical protein
MGGFRLGEQIAQMRAFGAKLLEQACQIQKGYQDQTPGAVGESRVLKMVVETNLSYFNRRIKIFKNRVQTLDRPIRKQDIESIDELESLKKMVSDMILEEDSSPYLDVEGAKDTLYST